MASYLRRRTNVRNGSIADADLEPRRAPAPPSRVAAAFDRLY